MAYTVQELRTALSKAEAANDEPAIRELKSAILRRSRVGLLPELQRDSGAVENLTRGIGAGIVGTVESAALGAAAILEEDAETKARDKIRSVADRFRPSGGDPESGLYKFGAGLGSLATFAVPGGAAAKGAQLLGAGVKAQRAAGLTTAGATGMGAGAGEASETS